MREISRLKPFEKTIQEKAFDKSMTLHTLQDKIKRQPEMYKNEFAKQMESFKAKLESFKENPAQKRDEQFEE